jgi:hypothetical protein
MKLHPSRDLDLCRQAPSMSLPSPPCCWNLPRVRMLHWRVGQRHPKLPPQDVKHCADRHIDIIDGFRYAGRGERPASMIFCVCHIHCGSTNSILFNACVRLEAQHMVNNMVCSPVRLTQHCRLLPKHHQVGHAVRHDLKDEGVRAHPQVVVQCPSMRTNECQYLHHGSTKLYPQPHLLYRHRLRGYPDPEVDTLNITCVSLVTTHDVHLFIEVAHERGEIGEATAIDQLQPLATPPLRQQSLNLQAHNMWCVPAPLHTMHSHAGPAMALRSAQQMRGCKHQATA